MKTIDETGQRIDGSSLNYFFKRIKSFIKMKFTYCTIYPFKVYNLTFFREFPGGPVVRSLHFHRLQGLEKGHIWEGHHFAQHSVYSLLILKLLFVFLLLSFVLYIIYYRIKCYYNTFWIQISCQIHVLHIFSTLPWWSFHFLDGVIWSTKVLNFNKVKFTYSFFCCLCAV